VVDQNTDEEKSEGEKDVVAAIGESTGLFGLSTTKNARRSHHSTYANALMR
jgi:hypothetical protein